MSLQLPNVLGRNLNLALLLSLEATASAWERRAPGRVWGELRKAPGPGPGKAAAVGGGQENLTQQL